MICWQSFSLHGLSGFFFQTAFAKCTIPAIVGAIDFAKEEYYWSLPKRGSLLRKRFHNSKYARLVAKSENGFIVAKKAEISFFSS